MAYGMPYRLQVLRVGDCMYTTTEPWNGCCLVSEHRSHPRVLSLAVFFCCFYQSSLYVCFCIPIGGLFCIGKTTILVPSNILRCIRVDVAPDLKSHRYLGCLFRLLAADDPNVDIFLCRDLDDALHPDGLRLVDGPQWPSGSSVHFQSESYDHPHRSNMANLGWFGQRNIERRGRPSVHVAILQYIRGVTNTDYYTTDEVFLTDVWLPLQPKPITRLPSYPFRRALLPPSRRPKQYRAFMYSRRPSVDLSRNDAVLMLA